MHKSLSYIRSLLPILLVGFGMFGCGALDTMDDMNHTTKHMDQTTSDMNNTTKDLDQKTQEVDSKTQDVDSKTSEVDQYVQHTASVSDHLSTSTDRMFNAFLNMYIDARQGDSAALRRDFWDHMIATPHVSKKLADAGAFFYAMEFQLWKDTFFDDPQNLDNLRTQAVDQFLRYAKSEIDYLNERLFSPPDEINPTDHNDHVKNLGAIAVTMHFVNPNETRLYADHHLQKQSMLDLLQNALSLRKEFDQKGKAAFPVYINDTLQLRPVAEYLLRMRVNFLAAMLFGELSRLGDKASVLQDWDGFWTMVFGFFGQKWTADVRDRDLAELLMYEDWIIEANKNCDWIHEYIGSCEVNANLQNLLRDMKFRSNPLDQSTPLIVQTISSIQTEVRKFLIKAKY